MIKISGINTEIKAILSQYPEGTMERSIAEQLNASEEVYRYTTESQLIFELTLRRSIVNAAKDLARSRVSFRVFRESKCNPEYWYRTNEGGFLLENDVKPSEGIRDIYVHSGYYGTECATAMVIVYYKALLDVLPEELFNRLFSNIYLMNWQHLDRDMGLTDFRQVSDNLPGDGRYFKNPDVDPETPEWQGENVFVLGNGMYFGHGIGIENGDNIIRALNEQRIQGSDISAYLLPSCKRLDFRYLSEQLDDYLAAHQPPHAVLLPPPVPPPALGPAPFAPPFL